MPRHCVALLIDSWVDRGLAMFLLVLYVRNVCEKCCLRAGIRNHCLLLMNINLPKQCSCQKGQFSLTSLPWCELFSITVAELMLRFCIYSRVHLTCINFSAIITLHILYLFSSYCKVV